MRDLMTTLLDLVGMLTVLAALVVLAWPFSVAGALAVAGVGLLFVSWLIDRRSTPARRPEESV